MTLTLKVEVAFNAGYGTAAGSRTWTDITNYVDLNAGIDIKVGRRDEFSVADPNTLQLTLDNSDGRFTPERTSSPYYPNVKLYRPIRVTATLPDASTSVRFLGYVTEWPTEWPGGSTGYAETTLTASSRMARLGSSTGLRSMLEQESIAAAPSAYYPLSEAAGALAAADIIGNGAPSLTMVGSGADVSFGSGTGPVDGLSAAQFASGKYLRAPLPGNLVLWASIPSAPAAQQVIASMGTGPTALVVDPSGIVSVIFGYGTATPTTGPATAVSMADGRVHQYSFGYSGAGLVALAYDGATSFTTVGGVPSGLAAVDPITIGAGPNGVAPFTGTISHVMRTTLSNLAPLYQVGTGALSETTAARLQRIAGYGSVPTAETSASGVVTVGTQDINGQTVLDALRSIETTESGVLYDARDGTLTLTSRDSRYTATVAFTLDASAQHLGADYKPVYDDTGLTNDMTVTGPTATARYFNATSISDHGPADASASTLATNVDEPLMLAGWKVNTYNQPITRVATLTVDVLPFASGAPSVMNIAGATVGTLVAVSNLPSQAISSGSSYFVEGYTEHFAPESWSATFNVSPAAPYLNVWTVEDSVLGQYDAYGLAL